MGSPSGLAPEFPGSQPGVLLLDDDKHRAHMGATNMQIKKSLKPIGEAPIWE